MAGTRSTDADLRERGVCGGPEPGDRSGAADSYRSLVARSRDGNHHHYCDCLGELWIVLPVRRSTDVPRFAECFQLPAATYGRDFAEAARNSANAEVRPDDDRRLPG